MSEINIKVKLKFEIGEKVYYCSRIKDDRSEIHNAKIKSASIGYNGKKTTVKYSISYQQYPMGPLIDSVVSVNSLYRTKAEITDVERTKRKQRLAKKVGRYKKMVKDKENELAKAKEELEEIKKEELVVKISGI